MLYSLVVEQAVTVDITPLVLLDFDAYSQTCVCLCLRRTCVVVKQFQEYTEPGSGEDGAPQRRSEEEESVLLPLGENTLTNNLGIPMVVVCTKVLTHASCIQIHPAPVLLLYDREVQYPLSNFFSPPPHLHHPSV